METNTARSKIQSSLLCICACAETEHHQAWQSFCRQLCNLFVEFALLVTQYSRITFVNSSESENSNDE